MTLLLYHFLLITRAIKEDETNCSHFSCLGEYLREKFGPLGIFTLGLIELLIPGTFLAYLLVFRLSESNHGSAAFFMLALAGLWSFVGPILIWQYEMRSIPHFRMAFLSSIGGVLKDQRFDSVLDGNAMRDEHASFVTPLWILLCSVTFMLSSSSLVAGFGIAPFFDWLWLYLFGLVVLFGFFTSIGFALAIKSSKLALLCANEMRGRSFYSVDFERAIGSVFFLARRTTWPLLSGILFIPLLSLTNIVDGLGGLDFSQTLVFIYSAVVLAISFFPMRVFMRVIRSIKTDEIAKMYSAIRDSETRMDVAGINAFTVAMQRMMFVKLAPTHANALMTLNNFGSFVLVPLMVNGFSSFAYDGMVRILSPGH